MGWAVSSERQGLAVSSHLKHLVKPARTLWYRILQDPRRGAGSLNQPVPLDGCCVASDQTSTFPGPSCRPFTICKSESIASC